MKLLSADFTPEALPIWNWNLMCVKQMSESLQCGATNKKCNAFTTVTLIKKKQLEELKTNKQTNEQEKKNCS